jgi:antirepressor regulating drug resistance, predicted signal transduction N-terminal membrane component
MDSLFTSVLEISWQAGLIALAVMAVRPLLRRAPRRAVCMLWLLVALRLLLPARLTVESPVSLQQPESPPIQAYQELRQQEKVYVSAPPEQRLEMAGPAAAQGFALLDQLPAIWLTGVGCMALYMALSLLRMRWRLRAAPRIQDNVYRCTDWSTPFVLGVLAPRIYVPETVSEQDFPQVLAHERCHIRRWDHVWKPLAFLLLAVNWFNPILWAAYVLLGRDMERACDEMVLKNATPAQRAAYSRALVACAAQPKMAAVCPLAFGEVAVKERVKNVLNYKKPALWAIILLVVAAAIIGVCLLTKPSYKNVGTLDAEKLFALRTEYVGDNAAVSGILDALGFRELGSSGADYGYAVHLSTDKEPMGITVLYTYEGAVPRKSEERYRQIAMRGYIALALIDNAEWFSWQEHGADGTSNQTDSTAGDWLYPTVYPGYPDTARESAEGLQAYINTLQQWMKDGVMPYAYGSGERNVWAWNADFPDASDEITPWPTLTENDPCSVRAEDYGIVYDAAQLPDWETVPLSYLCAYYLNGDGAYAEGAMDVLAHRYQQAPNTVKAYLRRLAGQQVPDGRGDASEVLLADISRYAMSQLTGGLPVAASYERDQLSISVSEVYSVTYRTVTYDENYSEDIPVYEVGSGAQLSVIKGEGFTLYGRHNEENVALHNGDVVELTEQFVGLGMDGQYAVRFQYRSAAETAELEVYQITWEAGDSTKQVVPLTEEQVQAIRSEKGLVQPEWYQVCAELRQGNEDVAYYMGNDYKPVPPTVLKILTEQCGYTFVTPEDFKGNMTSAKLEFYGGETYTADKADLPALQRMLTNARAYGGGASCGFGAKLTVTFDDGRTVSVLKGTDNCASFTFGSWNSAMVSDSENRQFWQMFGVPFDE